MPIKSKGSGERTAKLLGVGLRTLGRSIVNRVPGGDRIERSARYWSDVGEDWVKTLGDLRGAAMKMGQMASQYSDVLPKPLAAQLAKLQSAAEPLPFNELKPALERYWSKAQWNKIADIEPVAIAAASIGQVHRATLKNGREVIIKVRYPGIEQAVDSDVKQLRRLISASKLLPLDNTALDQLMEEIRQRFNEETDYAKELGHLKYLREKCQQPGIIYPEPVEALCGDGVLVMSLESGERLENIKGWSQQTRDLIGTRMCQWFAYEMFVAQAVHADPHPGNFAFRPDGSIVVYDFGCVKRVSAEVVEGSRRVLRAAWRSDWPELHAAQLAIKGVSEKTALAEIIPVYDEFARLILHRLCVERLFDYSDASFADDLREAGRGNLRHAFTFKPVSDLIFVLRALSGTYWMLRNMGARVPMGEVLCAHGVGPPAN